MKTRAMVNSTSGTKRATEMGPVHLNHHNMTTHKQSFVSKKCRNVRGVFLFAICTIQCILSTLAWVPMQTSFKVLEIKMQSPLSSCHLFGQVRPLLRDHGKVMDPVESPPVKHGGAGVQVQGEPGVVLRVEAHLGVGDVPRERLSHRHPRVPIYHLLLAEQQSLRDQRQNIQLQISLGQKPLGTKKRNSVKQFLLRTDKKVEINLMKNNTPSNASYCCCLKFY